MIYCISAESSHSLFSPLINTICKTFQTERFQKDDKTVCGNSKQCVSDNEQIWVVKKKGKKKGINIVADAVNQWGRKPLYSSVRLINWKQFGSNRERDKIWEKTWQQQTFQVCVSVLWRSFLKPRKTILKKSANQTRSIRV